MDQAPLWNNTGQRWVLDSNAFDAETRPGTASAAKELKRLWDLTWVELSVTDTAWAESSQNPDTYMRLHPYLSQYPIWHGPFTIGHSRLGMGLLAADESHEKRLRDVFATVWPNATYDDDAAERSRTGKNRFRDAMHVATSIQYHQTGLITHDRRLLDAAARVHDRYDGFTLATLLDAVERCKARARHVRHAASLHGHPDPARIPDWPE